MTQDLLAGIAVALVFLAFSAGASVYDILRLRRTNRSGQ